MSYIIDIENLNKNYGKERVVNNLTLKIKSGEIFALLGVNGAGKTTTIKMLLGLTNKTSGNIKYFGKDFITNKKNLLPRIGSVVGNAGFFDDLTVFKNLEIITNLIGFHKKDHIDEILETLSLLQHRDTKVKRLNKSQKQKLSIARALLNKPEILLLDEPINGLDPTSINEIRSLLLRLANERGVTVFLSSHVLSEVEKLADRIGIIHRGELLTVVEKSFFIDTQSEQIIITVDDVKKTEQCLVEKKIPYLILNDKDIQVQKKASEIPVIIEDLINAEIKLSQIYTKNTSLEDYFIDLIRDK